MREETGLINCGKESHQLFLGEECVVEWESGVHPVDDLDSDEGTLTIKDRFREVNTAETPLTEFVLQCIGVKPRAELGLMDLLT